MKPVGSHPALDRMRADPKLFGQQPGTVPLFQKQLHNPQTEIPPGRPGAGSSAWFGMRALGHARYRVTSSPCKRFLHSEVSPHFLETL
jgi:hypothetical protein